MAKQRLRMFAGPNGSGKSTIKSVIPSNLLGLYLNPDEIEKEVKLNGGYNFSSFNIEFTQSEINSFFSEHPLSSRVIPKYEIRCSDKFVNFTYFDSYLSAILTDFFRSLFLANGISFTFETVMSSPDKIKILQKAKQLGYRTYLYFIATEDPLINLLRIEHRVKVGGHNVPSEKIKERYFRSLELLADAIKYSNRAFIFDNSSESKIWISEIIDGKEIQIMTDTIPVWFKKYVLDKLT
ncbi:MAG: zeta toxin family protein [Spirosomataceae bacterium]